MQHVFINFLEEIEDTKKNLSKLPDLYTNPTLVAPLSPLTPPALQVQMQTAVCIEHR